MVSIREAWLLKEIGVLFEDYSADYILDSGDRKIDTFDIESGFDIYMSTFSFFSTSIRGSLKLELDGKVVYKAANVLPPYLSTIPLEVQRYARSFVTIRFDNAEDKQNLYAYTCQIIIIPSEKVELAQTVLGVGAP